MPRLAASSGSWSFAIDVSARSRARGFRVNSTEVASARNSRSRLLDAWTSAENSGATIRSSPATMSRKIPTRKPIARPARASVVVAAPDEGAVPPAFDDQPEEAVGHQRHEADQDGDVQGVAGVQVADVAELVPDDALELLAIHRLEQARRHRPRRVRRVATGREGVLAAVRDDVDARHRDVRRDRQLADDIEQDRVAGRDRPAGRRPSRG